MIDTCMRSVPRLSNGSLVQSDMVYMPMTQRPSNRYSVKTKTRVIFLVTNGNYFVASEESFWKLILQARADNRY